ncbi:hypothetical protein B9Z40_06050 [Limnohabitans sp. 15K]|nr:hypothetical protein B9Z40_06050 [Limnohabitans sp. 15K]
MGNLLEGLIFKASSASQSSFQQSYPQIFWIKPKVLKNQGLTSCFKKLANLQYPQIHLESPETL